MALINSKTKESFDDFFLFFLLLLSFCFWSHNYNDNMSVFFFCIFGCMDCDCDSFIVFYSVCCVISYIDMMHSKIGGVEIY